MASEPDRGERPHYRLELEVDGALLRLHIDGPDGSPGPTLRRHVAEVRQAAERCGLHLVVEGDDTDPGMLA